MSKHMDGPWFIAPNPDGGQRIGAPDGDDSPWWVAEICVCCGTDDTSAANARLIAAAPDLLEALKDLTHGLPELLESIGYQDEDRLIEKALAAIAKATSDTGDAP